jgi:hypothetical protein
LGRIVYLEAVIGSDDCFDRKVRDGCRDPDRCCEGDTVLVREWSPPRSDVVGGGVA